MSKMFANRKTKLEYRIKLLSDNNVVLVEAAGYESEIFVPEIVNGRISFLNIIPNRRCCRPQTQNSWIHSGPLQQPTTHSTPHHSSHSHCTHSSPKASRKHSRLPAANSENQVPYERKPSLQPLLRSWRMSAGQDSIASRISPLAFSTPHTTSTSRTPHNSPGRSPPRNSPARSPTRSHTTDTLTPTATENKENNYRSIHFDNRSSDLLSQNSLETPQAMRQHVPSPTEVLKDTLVQIPKGIKVIRLYRDPSSGAPKNVGHIKVSPMPSSTSASPHTERSSSNFPTLDTPEMSKDKSKSTSMRKEGMHSKKTSTSNMSPKWRKCLTPKRTYSRRPTVVVQRRTSGSSVKKSNRFNKICPTYLANPTQVPKVNQKVEVRKRKLIIDPKRMISPVSFKKQQRGNSFERTDSQLPAKRKQYEASKPSAFDLLIAPNRSSVANKLSEQFRKSCVNKASSTYPKYKMLCSIPPLEADDQIREFRRQLTPPPKRQEGGAEMNGTPQRKASPVLGNGTATANMQSPKPLDVGTSKSGGITSITLVERSKQRDAGLKAPEQQSSQQRLGKTRA